jgi:FAD/FMN-containing dehydrogenase
MSNLLEHLMSNDLVLDGALAQDTTQASAFWSLREGITESIGKSGKIYKYDLSVPVEKMYGLVTSMRQRLGEKGLLKEGGGGDVVDVVGFGHMGDGE